MTTYAEFFLNSKSSIVEIETIEISHPNFSKTYYIVRNDTEGISAKLETNETVEFEYFPSTITKTVDSDNLDQIFKITFGDLGEVLPTELDRVRAAGNFATKPNLIYRSYRSDDMETILNGPIKLKIKSIVFDKTGCNISAEAPSLNVNRTGEIYTLERFPMLKGLL